MTQLQNSALYLTACESAIKYICESHNIKPNHVRLICAICTINMDGLSPNVDRLTKATTLTPIVIKRSAKILIAKEWVRASLEAQPKKFSRPRTIFELTPKGYNFMQEFDVTVEGHVKKYNVE